MQTMSWFPTIFNIFLMHQFAYYMVYVCDSLTKEQCSCLTQFWGIYSEWNQSIYWLDSDSCHHNRIKLVKRHKKSMLIIKHIFNKVRPPHPLRKKYMPLECLHTELELIPCSIRRNIHKNWISEMLISWLICAYSLRHDQPPLQKNPYLQSVSMHNLEWFHAVFVDISAKKPEFPNAN